MYPKPIVDGRQVM